MEYPRGPKGGSVSHVNCDVVQGDGQHWLAEVKRTIGGGTVLEASEENGSCMAIAARGGCGGGVGRLHVQGHLYGVWERLGVWGRRDGGRRLGLKDL